MKKTIILVTTTAFAAIAVLFVLTQPGGKTEQVPGESQPSPESDISQVPGRPDEDRQAANERGLPTDSDSSETAEPLTTDNAEIDVEEETAEAQEYGTLLQSDHFTDESLSFSDEVRATLEKGETPDIDDMLTHADSENMVIQRAAVGTLGAIAMKSEDPETHARIGAKLLSVHAREASANTIASGGNVIVALESMKDVRSPQVTQFLLDQLKSEKDPANLYTAVKSLASHRQEKVAKALLEVHKEQAKLADPQQPEIDMDPHASIADLAMKTHKKIRDALDSQGAH